MRRRLGVCRTPVKHRFGHEVTRPPGDESAPPPMGPAAGPFYRLRCHGAHTAPRPDVVTPAGACRRRQTRVASAMPQRGWLARPVERADALRSRNGGGAIPRVVFRPCDPCRRLDSYVGPRAPDDCRCSTAPTRRGSGRVRAEAPFPASGVGPGRPACPERRGRGLLRGVSARVRLVARHVLRSSAKPARSSADPDHRFTGTEKLIYAKAPAVRHRRHRPRSQPPACGAGR